MTAVTPPVPPEPTLVNLSEKKLVGQHCPMSFSDNQTARLWQQFKPNLKHIRHQVGTTLYSLEIYPPSFFQSVDPTGLFEKWAAVEVSDFDIVPDTLHRLTLPAGRYAVFRHRGTAAEGEKTYSHIFKSWLPQSDFLLDDRPHIAMMPENYKPDDPAAEETIWIPVKPC